MNSTVLECKKCGRVKIENDYVIRKELPVMLCTECNALTPYEVVMTLRKVEVPQ